LKGKHDKALRMGLGEFQYPGGFNATRQEAGLDLDGPKKERLHAEALFLEAVFAVEPKVRSSLQALTKASSALSMHDDLPPALKEKIRRWCSRWHLNSRWCEEFAEQFVLQQLFESQPGGEKYSEEELKRRADAQERATQPYKEHRLKIDFGAWPITQWTRKRFLEECQRIFDRDVSAFCDGIERRAEADGMQRTREKRELDHFLWLARILVKGETADRIKRFSPKMEKISTHAIRKAITTLAFELDLHLP
jgi:hypothetical protein